ncbi:hypothetical protein RZS08_49670, partial [Arthrospira platensis SPKY1]|nr:hypothetical protein [Arthrospira platensis SPKY1]
MSVTFPIFYLQSNPGHMAGTHEFDLNLNQGRWIDESRMDNNSFGPVSVTVPSDCGVLTAPQQLAPPDGSVFNNYPRTTTLQWAPVPGAESYTVEVDCFHCCQAGSWCT